MIGHKKGSTSAMIEKKKHELKTPYDRGSTQKETQNRAAISSRTPMTGRNSFQTDDLGVHMPTEVMNVDVTQTISDILKKTDKTENMNIQMTEDQFILLDDAYENNYLTRDLDQEINNWADRSTPEAKRRYCALLAQFNQRRIDKYWPTKSNTFYLSEMHPRVITVSRLLRIDEQYPIYYKTTEEEWKELSETVKEMEGGDFEALERIMPEDAMIERMTTVWLMSRRKDDPETKFFQEADLKGLQEKGYKLPFLLQLESALDLRRDPEMKPKWHESGNLANEAVMRMMAHCRGEIYSPELAEIRLLHRHLEQNKDEKEDFIGLTVSTSWWNVSPEWHLQLGQQNSFVNR
ncbi:hypothetical protein CROQUDRAFT_169699 [Cronartium quercuum f. sp. fusiforme G11]|uniref:Uncharacterized protein n=1 Tax=Cronartium quercuum f. sp. fusiforme G11 TaxID=708437 RepID=A0A9P6NGM0_9BASI|nr:hypothetical protein CROQUDRAFT_169699 [Cronartium quercuum f. sp. fusiforme G11]